MTTLLSASGITTTISDIVAKASMKLPSLTNAYDPEFLKRQTLKTVSIFLRFYMEGAPKDERMLFRDAQNENDFVTSGVILHRCLGADPSPERMQAAFDSAEKEVNDGIVSEYETFVRDVTSKNSS